MPATRGHLRADAQRNRDQIMAAARAMFVRDGTGVPMEEIARQAGVSKGTLYRRFPDRDQLIQAVALDTYELLAGLARTAAGQEPDAWHALSRFLHDWAAARTGFLHDWMCQPLPGLLRASPQLRRARDTWLSLVDQLVRDAQAEGSLRTDIGTGDLALFINMLAQQRDVPEDLAGLMPGRFLALFLDGLHTPRPAPLPGTPVRISDLDASTIHAGQNPPQNAAKTGTPTC
jgi:AcrR family transcriptional regulator